MESTTEAVQTETVETEATSVLRVLRRKEVAMQTRTVRADAAKLLERFEMASGRGADRNG